MFSIQQHTFGKNACIFTRNQVLVPCSKLGTDMTLHRMVLTTCPSFHIQGFRNYAKLNCHIL
jgi:hypothetical protein